MSARIIHGDSLEVMRAMPPDSFDCAFSSPPYNIGKAYEKRQPMDAYEAWVEPFVSELVRIIKPGGSIGWQGGYHVKNGCVLPLDWVFLPMFERRA